MKFLSIVYSKLKFEEIVSDNGKEFNNSIIKNWCTKRGINNHFVPPYYHKAAGRVERVNQTLRRGLNKIKGALKLKLEKVVKNYNLKYHRGIGMTPNEALLKENKEKLEAHVMRYKKEFITKELPKFEIGDMVLIKNDIRSNKDDKLFDKHGKIEECLPRDTYKVVTKDGKTVIRNFSQLKVLPGDVVFNNNLLNTYNGGSGHKTYGAKQIWCGKGQITKA